MRLKKSKPKNTTRCMQISILKEVAKENIQAIWSSKVKVMNCWFSVMQFKIDQNKNQNRSIDKLQNLGNERR